MNRQLSNLLLFTAFFISTMARAQVIRPTQLDSVLGKIVKPGEPGFAAGIWQHDKLMFARGYGLADLSSKRKNTIATPFNIASMGKQFTAASIYLLEQRGRLSTSDKLSKYFPDFPAYADSITIDHLIHHQSGIKDYIALIWLRDMIDNSAYDDSTVYKMLVRQQSLNFTPGSQENYSNSGYFLLARIVQKVSGQDLPAFAAANIFKPLKMNHTQVSRTHKVAGKAQGYVSSGNGFVVANTKNSVVGQGNVYSMVTDFRPWFREMDKQQVLGAAVWKKMLTPGVLNNGEMTNYGGGLHITEDVITHGGDVAGYHSGMYHFPAKGFDIVVLSNNDHVSGRTVFRAIYGLLYPKQPIADAAVAAPVVAIDTLHYTGIYAAASDSLLNIELSVEDGNLMAEQLWNSEKYRIVAVSDSIFEIDGAPEVKFAFASAATEKAAAFDILQDGQRIAFKRTAKVAALDSRLAASYAGTYYNSEIDARYQVLVDEGKLIVVIGKERFVMSRFKDGVFGLDNGLVLEFNKGGFKLVHSRVWELQFEKI